jgi:hypothetical protein
MNLLRNFFPDNQRPTTAPHSNHMEPLSSVHDGSENTTRRQLIQMLVRDALLRYGIPTRWIECQILTVSSRSKGQGLHLRLIVKHWDARLMQYAVAFQNALMTELTGFEPRAKEWLHGISWQIDVGSHGPNLTMPDKSFWTEQTANPQGTPPPEEHSHEANDPRADLQRLFDIRDQALANPAINNSRSGYGSGQPDFEKTRPLGL